VLVERGCLVWLNTPTKRGLARVDDCRAFSSSDNCMPATCIQVTSTKLCLVMAANVLSSHVFLRFHSHLTAQGIFQGVDRLLNPSLPGQGIADVKRPNCMPVTLAFKS
jgi:hypothetical protein